MMFPENNHTIPCPKYFILSLMDNQIKQSYLYCLKFSENYSLILENGETKEIDVPIVIFIESEKHDLEAFKQLFIIINYIIINDDFDRERNSNLNINIINNYKKIQLLNIFYFIFSLSIAPPHSLVKLKIDKEIIYNNIESIDFYFCSNCEIPCNNNDTDINVLFSLLDQSIIIKALLSILIEKKIVFMASKAYLLHIIIPSFLKLIFPFKWVNKLIIVLPKERLNELENPNPFIFGAISDIIPLNYIMIEYPEIIIVDCDTNEIFCDKHFEAYEPPRYIPKNNFINKDNEKKDKILYMNQKLMQGNNLINIEGSYLYIFEPDINMNKKKLIFDRKDNIIIDTNKSQLFIEKTNSLIDSNEWKWLRNKIQLVRNPEIFDLDSIDYKKNKINNIYLDDKENENVNIILPNMPFSYNIQNIFMTFILNKLKKTESQFMSIFKYTDMFKAYNDIRQYQNNSSRLIAKNISELVKEKQQINIYNSFIIEYNLQNFQIQTFLERIDTKLEKNNLINESEAAILNKIKLTLKNYEFVKNEEISNNYDNINRKTEMKKSIRRPTKIISRSSERVKQSLIKKSINTHCNLILSSKDKSVKRYFNFYNKDGFINFINIFEKFLKKENINIKEELFEEKINEQIAEIIVKNEELFNKNMNISEVKNINTFIKKRNSLNKNDMKKNNIIFENEKNNSLDINNDNYYGRKFVLQNYDADEIKVYDSFKFDLGSSINSTLNNYEMYDLDKYLYNENIISFFPSFSGCKEENKIQLMDNNDIMNLKCNYYLYIGFLLENLLKNKRKCEEFINKIKNKKIIDNLDIKSLILKMYIIAYQYSGKKHQNFPYYSYYSFLHNINIDDLQLLKSEFDDYKEKELFDIYNKIINGQEVFAKINKKNSANIEFSKMNFILDEKNEKQKYTKIEKKKSPVINNLFSLFEKKDEKNSDFSFSSDFNPFKTYTIIINIEFESNILNMDPNKIIIDFARELLSIFHYKKVFSDNNIITDLNSKLSENNKIFELISQLKYINIEAINGCKERLCFWVNCFNFLIIFTIIYKKWNLNNKEEWKYFFQKVKFLIGDQYFSFNDMLYLLYKKIIFFPSIYKKNPNIKKFRVNKAYDAKSMEKVMAFIYSPFMLYLPTKGFKKPVILEEKILDSQLNKIVIDYLNEFIIIDPYNDIIIPELLYDYQPRFLWKDFKKFQSFLKGSLYSFIKDKKYKGYNITLIDLKLDFKSLFDS